MNSLTEGKIRDYLVNDLHYPHEDCGTVVERIRHLAVASGHMVDERFGHAGLGAGPEALVASRIVDSACGRRGHETPEHAVRREIDGWLHRSPRKGKY